jgi:hypothetical protein
MFFWGKDSQIMKQTLHIHIMLMLRLYEVQTLFSVCFLDAVPHGTALHLQQTETLNMSPCFFLTPASGRRVDVSLP